MKRLFTLAFGFLFIAFLLKAQPAASNAAPAEESSPGAATSNSSSVNWMPMFEQAGNEFGVPPEVLASIAFNSTHWEQVTWPTAEADPHFAPHQFGVMGLWDNDTFGHELTDAARLLGTSTDEIRNDPLQNIRAAAALLKNYYQQATPPEGTTVGDIESWRNAIAKFSGFPERDVSQTFSLGVYEQIAKGDEERGWKPRQVNLDAIREAVAKIKDEENKKREAQAAAEQNQTQPTSAPASGSSRTSLENKLASFSEHKQSTQTSPQNTETVAASPAPTSHPAVLFAIVGSICGVLVAFVMKRKRR